METGQVKESNCEYTEMTFQISVLHVKFEGCGKDITEKLLLQNFEGGEIRHGCNKEQEERMVVFKAIYINRYNPDQEKMSFVPRSHY